MEPQAAVDNDAEEEEGGQELLQDDFEDLQDCSAPQPLLDKMHSSLSGWTKRTKELAAPHLPWLLRAGLLVACVGYFCCAMARERLQTEGSRRLLAVACLLLLLLAARAARRLCGSCSSLRTAAATFEAAAATVRLWHRRHRSLAARAAKILFLLYFGAVAFGVGGQRRETLVSAVGVFVILLLGWLLSQHPSRVNWQPVLAGLALQLGMAAALLRWPPGLAAFAFIGDRVVEFVQHADSGAAFVFGNDFRHHFFAFAVLPMIIFISSFIALLFHLGVLRAVIDKLGWAMQLMMGTTAAESLVAAANIFIGMMEAPLLIRPFAGRMTNSELHSVMTCGYATIAGAGMAAYIGMGVPARHLISASFLVAPAALAMSKLLYPETKKTKTDTAGIKEVKVANYHNAVDAIGTGAMKAVEMVCAIAANLIAFISMLAFVNATLTWLGERVCLPFTLTFGSVCGFVLWPVAYTIGVGSRDCYRVAELIGTKFFINEFIAYKQLLVYQEGQQQFASLNATNFESDAGANLLTNASLNATLSGELLFEERSVAIATYALCGFANVGSVGMQLGLFAVLLPRRKVEILPLAVRGVFTATLANLLTACVAGIFI